MVSYVYFQLNTFTLNIFKNCEREYRSIFSHVKISRLILPLGLKSQLQVEINGALQINRANPGLLNRRAKGSLFYRNNYHRELFTLQKFYSFEENLAKRTRRSFLPSYSASGHPTTNSQFSQFSLGRGKRFPRDECAHTPFADENFRNTSVAVSENLARFKKTMKRSRFLTTFTRETKKIVIYILPKRDVKSYRLVQELFLPNNNNNNNFHTIPMKTFNQNQQ